MVKRSPIKAQVWFYGDVDQDTKKSIRSTVHRAMRFMKIRRLAGPKEATDVGVWGEGLSPEEDACGTSTGFQINLYLLSSCWAQFGETERMEVIVHETFHNLQGHFLNRLDTSPTWINEGTAEYVAVEALHEWGVRDKTATKAVRVGEAQRVGTPLQALESGEAWFDAHETYGGGEYSLAYVAADHLLGDRDWQLLADYYRRLSEGKRGAWRSAFRRTFKISPQEFYEDFADYRATGFR